MISKDDLITGGRSVRRVGLAASLAVLIALGSLFGSGSKAPTEMAPYPSLRLAPEAAAARALAIPKPDEGNTDNVCPCRKPKKRPR